MKLKNLFLFIFLLSITFKANAYEIYIRGKQEVTITKPEITLSDIASIESTKSNLDEIVISIGKTFIEKSPKANKQVQISANKIVEIMKKEGLKLDKIGYVFPRSIKVTRAGRLLTEAEVMNAINNFFKDNKREITINKIYLKDDIYVTPDDLLISVESFSKEPYKKDMGNFLLNIKSSLGDTQKVVVNARVEEWKDIPVANRQIYKGEVVEEDDFIMARMNIANLPKESFDMKKEVIGKEATRNISKGDIFSNKSLVTPPIIKTGDKIKIEYKTALLTAVATGVALEDGGASQKIKIKNDSSNKILEGFVVNEGLVRVN